LLRSINLIDVSLKNFIAGELSLFVNCGGFQAVQEKGAGASWTTPAPVDRRVEGAV
jgi:hypothetical protein